MSNKLNLLDELKLARARHLKHQKENPEEATYKEQLDKNIELYAPLITGGLKVASDIGRFSTDRRRENISFDEISMESGRIAESMGLSAEQQGVVASEKRKRLARKRETTIPRALGGTVTALAGLYLQHRVSREPTFADKASSVKKGLEDLSKKIKEWSGFGEAKKGTWYGGTDSDIKNKKPLELPILSPLISPALDLDKIGLFR